MDSPDLSDPRWFPVDYRVPEDSFAVSRVDAELLGRANFLDERLGVSAQSLAHVPARNIELRIAQPPAFLFHTAFCGSTLLARALHAPPGSVSLKEPQALLSLATGRRMEPAFARARLVTALALLARPWSPGGRVLIKPTNQANNLIAPMLAASPESRAILLHSSLEEFLLSCFKKLPEAETRVRWMAQHLIVGTRLAHRLGVSPHQPFNLVESCVLTWFAQMELYADALATDSGDRLRSLDMRAMLGQPVAAVQACREWLQLDAGNDLPARVADVFARDSKAGEREFDSELREQEKARVQEAFGDVIRQACDWAQRSVAPVATMPSDWKPLAIGNA